MSSAEVSCAECRFRVQESQAQKVRHKSFMEQVPGRRAKVRVRIVRCKREAHVRGWSLALVGGEQTEVSKS